MKNKRSAAACFRNYRFHSIFWKNLMLIFCVVLLPFLCTLLVSAYTYDELWKNETQSYSNELMARASMDIGSLFEESRDSSIRIGFEEDVQTFIRGYSTVSGAVDMAKYLSIVRLSKDEIDSVYVYSGHSNTVISAAGKSYYSHFADKACLDQWDSSGEMIQIRHLPAEGGKQGAGRIAFYFKPGYVKENRTGCIIFNYDLDKLAEKFDYGDNVRLMLLQKGLVLYDSEGGLGGEYIDDTQTLLNTDRNTIAVSEALELYDLRIVLHVDSHPLFERLQHIRLTTVLLMLVALLATVLVVFYISRKIFDPISELLALLEENQELDAEGLMQTKDEISYIRLLMSTTISKTKDIEEELGRRMKLLKKAQAVALQAQINPHFMYNTIDTINWMAIRKIGKGNEVSQMLNMLSQLLRYSLGNTDTFVSLEEEIDYAKKYVLVQQIRCNYGFEVLWDIPEELGKCNVIKMILQPVVENAIKYGIKPFGGGGSLQIRAIRVGETIRIFVSDSGFGLTQEEADEINRAVNRQVIKESDHIGLSNVHQRINLMFGDQYGVTVRSKINEGTTVELTIPYLQ